MAGFGRRHSGSRKNDHQPASYVVSLAGDDRIFPARANDCSPPHQENQQSAIQCCRENSPVGYAIAVLLAYCAVAGALQVSLVFAAFLAGFAVVHKKRRLFADALDAIGKVSFAFFVPVYFALVGLKLDLIRGASLWMVVAFIA